MLGVDPVAAATAESSRRASKSAAEALFVAASAESFAAELPGIADRLVVNFPWGSLLRGVLGADQGVAAAIGAIVRDAGTATALVSVTPRDRLPGVAVLDEATVAYLPPPPGLELVEARPASRAEILATRSTWGRRLVAGAGRVNDDRPVWRLEWRRR